MESHISIRENKKDLPVVILVMGGAWIIGYRVWCALLAKYLAENGKLSKNLIF